MNDLQICRWVMNAKAEIQAALNRGIAPETHALVKEWLEAAVKALNIAIWAIHEQQHGIKPEQGEPRTGAARTRQ